MQRYIDAATLAGRRNLDGRLAVKATAGLPFLLEEGMGVWLVPPVTDAPRHVTVTSIHMEGEGPGASATVSFAEVGDADTAEMLAGCHCLVPATLVDTSVLATAAANGGVHPLVGWRISDSTSGLAGTVVDAENMPEQALLHIEVDSRPGAYSLVPLVDEFVECADEESRFLEVALPNGIFDI